NPLPSLHLKDPKPERIDEPDVQAKVVALFDSAQVQDSSLGNTIFNLILPPGTVLALGDADSLNGLGGYHGSVHVNRRGRRVTLYYSANVFSQAITGGQVNGIPAFD